MAQLDGLIASKFCRQGDIVLDIGAYHGESTRSYLDCGARMVHAFEPTPESFAVLTEQFADEPRVRRYNLAVGATDGSVEFLEQGIAFGKGSIEPGFAARVAAVRSSSIERRTVSCVTLDSLDLGPTDFWKVDIEGAENQLFAGAQGTLSAMPPRVLQMEIFDTPYNAEGHRARTFANYDRFFARCYLAGITESGALGIYDMDAAGTDSVQEAVKASQRGGAPTFLFSNEPLL